MWNSAAFFMLASVSSSVRPVDAQPGTSGDYPEKPVSVFSTTIRYSIECTNGKVVP